MLNDKHTKDGEHRYYNPKTSKEKEEKERNACTITKS